uniref:Response regulatory domain-containing protein n=1 Tax=Ascaris lumbricoides TaxID=6252 RepID=A0A0M3II03_ASCLU
MMPSVSHKCGTQNFRYLVIIDSDLEDSFNAIMEARDYILIAGSEVHAAEMREMLHEMNIPNGDAAVKILDDKNLTNFERFALLREFLIKSPQYLVIIDSDLEDSFNAIMEARDYILIAGSEVHAAEMREMLHEMNIPNGDAAVKILDDKNLTNFERFALLREFIPAEVDLPTRLPTGFVFAPCPHDQGCPKLSSKNGSVCKFSTRWREIRADGKVGKRRDGTAIGSFAYVIMQKGIREPVENLACLLQVVHSDKHLTCTVCTPFIGIQRFTISKRAGPIYQSVKARKPGQLLPVTIKPVASESQFDVYEEAIKGFEKSAP